MKHTAFVLPPPLNGPYQGYLVKANGWFSVLILFNLWVACGLDGDSLVLEALGCVHDIIFVWCSYLLALPHSPLLLLLFSEWCRPRP